jgi:xylan 1,4-beta-xylosidase
MLRRTRLIFTLALAFAFCPLAPPSSAQPSVGRVTIDAHAASTPFPHFWVQMFGSGRAVLSMRQSYRDDMHAVKQVTDFKYVRFHAILHDEVGVYDEDAQGQPIYNFSYVDQIYDSLLANGVRPLVEISFMPKKLAFAAGFPCLLVQAGCVSAEGLPQMGCARDCIREASDRPLWHRRDLTMVFRSLEGAQYRFLDWDGPRSKPILSCTITRRALKAVNQRIRVGGPATAQAA